MTTINISSPDPLLIRCCSGGPQDETIIIELQGSIETDEGSELFDTSVGELVWEGGKNDPYLIVGNHRLTGKVVELKPPLAFLYRKNAKSIDQNIMETGESESTSDYFIRAIITKKLRFNKRPEVLMDAE